MLLFVWSNLFKYLLGGIWYLVEWVWVLCLVIGGGFVLVGVIFDLFLIVVVFVFVVVVGGW